MTTDFFLLTVTSLLIKIYFIIRENSYSHKARISNFARMSMQQIAFRAARVSKHSYTRGHSQVKVSLAKNYFYTYQQWLPTFLPTVTRVLTKIYFIFRENSYSLSLCSYVEWQNYFIFYLLILVTLITNTTLLGNNYQQLFHLPKTTIPLANYFYFTC